ncbi:MAG: ROK family transcriptional regulator [Pseudomonadota bacterium]
MKKTRGKADTELVRQQNRSLVLEALRKHGALASIELGEKTGLSPATISAITNDMIAERLIENDEEETARHRLVQRGRPKIKLKLAASAAIIVGIRLTHNTVALLLTDFSGDVKVRQTIDIETSDMSADAFSQMLVERTKAFLNDNDVDPSRVSIASIACQGSVDATRGEIIWSPAFSARNIKIAEPLERAFDFPCIVANDTNAIAHALHVEDETLSGSFAVLYLGSGIGLGLFVNNMLIEGTNGSTSEFGHMLFEPNGALCRCGRRGCIEAYGADFGIARSANRALKDLNPADISPTLADMEMLAEAARGGDAESLAAFERAGTAIGVGLANLVLIVNPQRILFTGPGITHFDLMRESLCEAVTHAKRAENGLDITVLDDDRDLIEVGLLSLAFTRLDQEIFAKRVTVQEMASRHGLIGA